MLRKNVDLAIQQAQTVVTEGAPVAATQSLGSGSVCPHIVIRLWVVPFWGRCTTHFSLF